jgi:hypothetical protein
LWQSAFVIHPGFLLSLYGGSGNHVADRSTICGQGQSPQTFLSVTQTKEVISVNTAFKTVLYQRYDTHPQMVRYNREEFMANTSKNCDLRSLGLIL